MRLRSFAGPCPNCSGFDFRGRAYFIGGGKCAQCGRVLDSICRIRLNETLCGQPAEHAFFLAFEGGREGVVFVCARCVPNMETMLTAQIRGDLVHSPTGDARVSLNPTGIIAQGAGLGPDDNRRREGAPATGAGPAVGPEPRRRSLPGPGDGDPLRVPQVVLPPE